MKARENKCQSLQNDILHIKFSEIYLCFQILVKFEVYFLGLP